MVAKKKKIAQGKWEGIGGKDFSTRQELDVEKHM